jgi:hypothetical protein
MLIKSTNLDKARLMDFYQVMSLTSSFLQKEDTAALKLSTVASDFNTALSSLDKALKQAQKTGYTDAIIAADDERDSILTGFLGTLRNLLRFPDKIIMNATAKLLVVTEKYGPGITQLPQREETATLTSMVADLRSAENAPMLQTANLTIWVDKLDEANRAFDDLYRHRNGKESEFIIGLTRTERANMQAVFEKLVQAIEAYAFINEAPLYQPLAEKINTEVANVQQATKTRATLSANAARKKTEE